MGTVTFMITVFLGLSILFSTYLLFTDIKEEASKSSYHDSLQVLSKEALVTLEAAYIQAKKSSLESSGQPAANISFTMPEKIGGQEYLIAINGTEMKSRTEDGAVQLEHAIPFSINTSAELDSKADSHRISVYRLNSTNLRFDIY